MTNINDLSQLEVPEKIRQKLAERYKSIDIISRTSAHEIANEASISLKMAKKAISSARKILRQAPITAMDLLKEYRNKRRLTTGSLNLDEILNGGIPTGSITEIIGEFSAGKSQLAFQLCVNVQLPFDIGGLEGSAYFIDTEGTFSPNRIFEIAQGLKTKYPDIINPMKVLENIYVGKAFSVDQQLKLIKDADNYIVEKNVRLVVIDSIASHFRTEYPGKDNLSARAQALMNHASLLYRFADAYDIAVVTTNQVIASMERYLGGGTITEPSLGFAWGHRPQTRIFLTKQKRNLRLAKIIDSSELAEQEAIFAITANGIEDPITFEE